MESGGRGGVEEHQKGMIEGGGVARSEIDCYASERAAWWSVATARTDLDSSLAELT